MTDLNADQEHEVLQERAREIGADAAETAAIVSKEKTQAEVLADRQKAKEQLVASMNRRSTQPEPDEPRATPAGALSKAVARIGGYATAVKVEEQGEIARLHAELEPTVALAAVLKKELEQVREEHGTDIVRILSMDFQRLMAYPTCLTLVQTIYRVASFAQSLLSMADWLAGVSGEIRREVVSTRITPSPAGMARHIRETVEACRGNAAQVRSYVAQLSELMKDLEARLERAGEPHVLIAPQTFELPNPNAVPSVVRDLPDGAPCKGW